MKLRALNAISPIDGRYRKKTESLSEYFSEESLIKYRLKIEIEYFIALCKIPIPELKTFLDFDIISFSTHPPLIFPKDLFDEETNILTPGLL